MRHQLHRIIPYAILAASVGITGAAALTPAANRPVAAIFPPWWTAERTFSAAAQSGAVIMRLGRFSSILVLTPGTPGLRQRLRDAGAWLLLDALALGGCTTSNVSADAQQTTES